jgi:CRISPR-associated protein Cas2
MIEKVPSQYQAMWLFTMFDLPVDTPKARRDYATFRKVLLRQGFLMLQFSVYARYCESEERSDALRRRIRSCLPPEGQVRLLAVTDHQFGKMQIFEGKIRAPTEDPPEQLLLF